MEITANMASSFIESHSGGSDQTTAGSQFAILVNEVKTPTLPPVDGVSRLMESRAQ